MQIDDLNAINVFFRTVNPRTPQAFDLRLKWPVWFDSLTWFDKHANSTILTEATTRRKAFNAVNEPRPIIITTDKGKTQIMATPTKLTIKQGSTGQNVIEWQRIVGALPADGKFGPNTTALTKKWQEKNLIKADGIVGPKTWEKALQGNNVFTTVAAVAATKPIPVKSAVIPPKPKSPITNPYVAVAVAASSTPKPIVSSVKPAVASTLLRQGSQGANVSEWQKIVGVKPDGIFGSGTAAATKNWQTAHNLMPDGIVGPATWAASTIKLKNPPPQYANTPQYTAPVKPVKLPSANPVIAAAQTASESVTNSVSNVVNNIRNNRVADAVITAPGKVLDSIKTAVLHSVKTAPLWMRIVGGFALGGVSLLGIQAATKKKD
jgi:peptidoglycan hydrolase-like protein with peptidoglycan-binding domain